MAQKEINEMLIGLSEVGYAAPGAELPVIIRDAMRYSPTNKITVSEDRDTEYHGGTGVYNYYDWPTEATVEMEVTPEGIAWLEKQRKIGEKAMKMAEKIIDGILDYLGDGVIQPHGYVDVEPIMTNFITSPPRALTGKEFINAINDFFNQINTLEETRYSLCNNVASIHTKEYTMSDGGKCYLIWVQGLLCGYDRTRDSNEYFTMNSLFFVNRVKDENGIMRWRIVDRLAEKGLPSPSSAFKQARDNGDF